MAINGRTVDGQDVFGLFAQPLGCFLAYYSHVLWVLFDQDESSSQLDGRLTNRADARKRIKDYISLEGVIADDLFSQFQREDGRVTLVVGRFDAPDVGAFVIVADFRGFD